VYNAPVETPVELDAAFAVENPEPVQEVALVVVHLSKAVAPRFTGPVLLKLIVGGGGMISEQEAVVPTLYGSLHDHK
jgi:hypothetical protein